MTDIDLEHLRAEERLLSEACHLLRERLNTESARWYEVHQKIETEEKRREIRAEVLTEIEKGKA